jgi:GntR family transcriptional regulator
LTSKQRDRIPIRVDTRPLYALTVDALTELLSRGVYKPGSALPKENILAEQIGVSKSTLRVALGHLEARGEITRRPGVGTFVAVKQASLSNADLMIPMDRLITIQRIGHESGFEIELLEREIEEVDVTPDCIRILGAKEGEKVLHCRILKAIGGKPGAYLETFLLPELVDLHELQNSDKDIVNYMIHHDQIKPVRTQTSIASICAGSKIAERLQVDLGEPLLELIEIFIDTTDRAVALGRNYFLTNHFGFSIVRQVIG